MRKTNAIFTGNNLLKMHPNHKFLHKLSTVNIFTIWVKCIVYQLFCAVIAMHWIYYEIYHHSCYRWKVTIQVTIHHEGNFLLFFLGKHHGVNRRRVRGSSKSLGFMNVHQLVVKIFQSAPKLSGDPWCKQGIKTQAVNLIIIIAVLLYCLNAIVVY